MQRAGKDLRGKAERGCQTTILQTHRLTTVGRSDFLRGRERRRGREGDGEREGEKSSGLQ